MKRLTITMICTLVLIVFFGATMFAQEQDPYSAKDKKPAPKTEPPPQEKPIEQPKEQPKVPQAKPTTTEEGLVAYYTFNGNADDASGSKNHGNVHEATLTRDRFGNMNSAYQFKGEQYIAVPNSPSLQSMLTAMSFAGWFYCDEGYISWTPIFSKSNDETFGQYNLEIMGNDINVQFGEDKITFNYDFKEKKWNFIAFSWDGEKIIFYVDAIRIGQEAMRGKLKVNDMPLEIGRHTPGNTEYLNGRLDDLRFYNKALTEKEIVALFNEGKIR